MSEAFSSVQVIRLDNTNVTLVFAVVSHRVPKMYYICKYIVHVAFNMMNPNSLAFPNSKICLRSTKWNASLILLRDYAELVTLCKVMFWKTHIPVRTQKWPPRLIFAGACHGIVINYVTLLLLTMVTASNLVR